MGVGATLKEAAVMKLVSPVDKLRHHFSMDPFRVAIRPYHASPPPLTWDNATNQYSADITNQQWENAHVLGCVQHRLSHSFIISFHRGQWEELNPLRNTKEVVTIRFELT